MSREIKIEYGFTNHAPIRMTIIEIEAFYDLSMGEIKYRRQFTGLRDVNGVEIYEGDIISGSSKVFKETCGEVELSSYLDNEEYMHQYHLGWHVNGIPLQDLVNDGLAVTGNVFEHPHLLDEAK